MHDLARLQLDNEEGKERTEEEIRDLQKITGPYFCRVIAQERFPRLSIVLKTVYTRAGIELTGPQEGCKLADISSRDYPQETAIDQEPDSE